MDRMTPHDIYHAEPMYQNPYLINLSHKFFQAGIETIGDISKLTERDMRKRFRTSDMNIERVKSLLSEFGLHLSK